MYPLRSSSKQLLFLLLSETISCSLLHLLDPKRYISLPSRACRKKCLGKREGLWLVKVNDAFCARFCSCAFRVFCAIPDDHPFSPILEVTQLKAEDLAWSESPMQHEENHRPVPFEPERGKELARLIIIQRTRHSLDGFHADGAPHGSLSGYSAHEGTVTISHSCVGRIIHFLDRIFTGRKLIREDQVLVKRRHGGQDAIDGRGRETRGRSPLSCRRREYQCETVGLFTTGKHAEVFQEQ